MRTLLLAAATLAASTAVAEIRPPAVAGAFYPDDPQRLRTEVRRLLEVQATRTGARAVVVPHAGYAFSGQVAADTLATVDGTVVRRVILLGPSHHRSFAGAALPKASETAFATPLGDVEIDVEAVSALRRAVGFDGPPEAHAPEHSLEVELPLLQLVAPRAKIVPVLVGNATGLDLAAAIARGLLPLIDDRTLVVVSSDFTHHGARYGWSPFSGPDLGEQLLRLGRLTAGRLAANDPVGFARQVEVSGDTVCGFTPSLVLAQLLAHAFDGAGEIVDVTTSGHRTGRWDLSVTYAGIAFFGAWTGWRDDPPPQDLGTLTPEQGRRIAALARAVIETSLRHDGGIAAWYAATDDRTVCRARAGAFVTLHRHGVAAGDPHRLRACMGVIEADQSLDTAVVQAAVWATRDPRFPPLEVGELDEIEVEVSLLSPSRPVAGPSAIEVGTHGVVLSKGRHTAVFLPQVAVEQRWNRRQMLDQLARKAGLPADGWRDGARFEVFTAQVFQEAQ
jgi:AmmeMemoRadiSam system protein B/AmmeMemoRadiSam system protein A